MIDLTGEQRDVEAQIDRFIRQRCPAKQWLTYTGLAGCGKSVLLAHIARKYPGALLCAFTGKAASVIARKSGLPAQTIHSALYTYYGKDAETDDPKFGRKVKAGEWEGKLVLIDEAGTVNQWLAQDLLATGCKIVACGDPGQLAPVKGVSFFTQGAPDAQLREVHRQAWDSAIIRQAHNVRSGNGYHADGSDFRVESHISREDILVADVVLCYRNATRCNLNRLVRAHHGYSGIARAKEPIMALKNSAEWGVLNGAVYPLLEDHIGGSGQVCIVNERGEEVCVKQAWIEDMEAPIVAAGDKDDTVPWAFAYVATCHKYQGSEAARVILVDEYDRPQDRDRWVYTGITRASQSIIVQKGW